MNITSTPRVFHAFFFFFLLTLLMSPNVIGQYFNKSYAVVIGINHVPSSRWHRLSYAEGDAKAVGDLLASEGYEVTRLYGPDATKLNIISKMIKLARALTANDRVIIYFAGHGYTERLANQSFGYLVPYDGGDNSAAYISMDEMRTFSAQMGAAKHQLFIIDACFSGLLITRSGGVDPAIPDYISEVAKRPARQVIAAGGVDQEVLDTGADGHSIFTHALLEALDLGFADKREDGYILFSDVMSYLVARASNAYQTPVGGDLPGHGLGEFMFASPKRAAKRPPRSEPVPGALRRGDTSPPVPEPVANSPEGGAKKTEEAKTKFEAMKTHFTQGNALLERERAAKAETLKAEPGQRDTARQNLAELSNQAAKEFQDAMQQAAGEKDPNLHLLCAKLGEVYDLAGRNDEAAQAYQQAISAKPDVPGYYNNLGNVLARGGKFDDAKAAYAKSAELDPQSAPTAWRNFGISLYNANRLGDAIEPLQKSAELDPKNPQTWYLLGASLMYKMTIKKVGDKEVPQVAPGTIEAYQKAVELDPDGQWGQQAKLALEQIQLMAPGINVKFNAKKKRP